MNVAHFLTLTRLMLSPLFPIIYLGREWFNIPLIWIPFLLLSIMIICWVTDLLDGVVARKRNQVTNVGKVLDPIVDTITQTTMFLTFTQGFVNLPFLLVLVFLYRDFLIITLRILCAMQGVALGARSSGKLKTFIQNAAAGLIVISMIPYALGYISLPQLQTISICAVSVAVIFTLIAAADYLISYKRSVRV